MDIFLTIFFFSLVVIIFVSAITAILRGVGMLPRWLGVAARSIRIIGMVTILVAFVVMVVVGVQSTPTTNSTYVTSSTQDFATVEDGKNGTIAKFYYTIDNTIDYYNLGLGYIDGRVVNATSKTYSYLQIQIGLYASENVKVGSCMANINNIAPQQTWQFHAVCSHSSNANSYIVESITGF